ncbi:MAG: LytR/AlgR family response regulator transcription factor [Gemmatimonadales bacterium]
MSTRSVVIVDDEPPARRKLRAMLAARPELEVVAEAVDGLDAVRVLEERRPDLALLDLRMPELDGFEVLRAIDPGQWPVVIFVTAFDASAVDAFALGAVDYIQKPVTRERLDQALDRALQRLGSLDRKTQREALLSTERAQPLERFVVRSLGKLRVVELDDIRWIESAGNYVKLHTADGVHLVRGALRALERRLDPARFVRIHRSTLVALGAIDRFTPVGHGDYTAVLASGERLTLSRRYRDRLPDLLPKG